MPTPEARRARAKAALVGILTTAILQIVAKLAALAFASENVDSAVNYLIDNQTWLVGLIVASASAGFFAQKSPVEECPDDLRITPLDDDQHQTE